MPQARVSGRRADRLRRRLRQPAAHQGQPQRDEDRHARGGSRVRGARGRIARTTSSPISTTPGASRGSTRTCTRCATSSPASSGACGLGTLHGGVHMWLNDLGLGALVPGRCATTSPTTRRCRPPTTGAAHRVSEVRRRGDVRQAVVGVPVEHEPRGGPAGPPAAARSRDPGRGQPRAVRRPRGALLPGGRVRVRRAIEGERSR